MKQQGEAKKLAKTAAQRQKAYRERRAQHAGEVRINTWVSARAQEALASLAVRYGVTQKVMLERLILKSDDGVIVTSARGRGRLARDVTVADSVTQSQSALWDEPRVVSRSKGNKVAPTSMVKPEMKTARRSGKTLG